MDPMERFQDNPNMIISDKILSLSWLPKDSRQDTGKWVNWQEAHQYVGTMNSVYPGGFNDFRLPTGEEAKKFFDFHLTNTDFEGESIHIHPVFVDKCSYLIWTSDVNEHDQALRINLRTGEMYFVDKNIRELHAVRLCRNVK